MEIEILSDFDNITDLDFFASAVLITDIGLAFIGVLCGVILGVAFWMVVYRGN